MPRTVLTPAYLCCLLPVALVGCRARKPQEPPVPEIAVFSVLQRDTPIHVEFNGTLEATEQVDLRAKVDGFLEKQWVPDGADVKLGQVLFTIDPKPLRASLDEARANMAKAQSAYDNAKATLARIRGLESSQIVSRQQVDDAVTAEKSAASSLTAARAELEHAQQNLSYASLRSPMDGRMGKASVQAGALVVQGQTVLATVSSDRTMKVTFGISENDYLQTVKAQMAGSFPKDPKVSLILADGTVYPSLGHISFVDRALGASTGTLSVMAEFPNPDRVLRPGLSAKVRFEVGQEDQALLVPQQAVQELLGRPFVVVVAPDGTVAQRPITLGAKTGPFRICTTGLKAGELVAMEGFHMLQPGTVVRPKPLTESALSAPKA